MYEKMLCTVHIHLLWGTALMIQSSVHILHPCTLFELKMSIHCTRYGAHKSLVVSCPLCHLLHVSIYASLYDGIPTVTLLRKSETLVLFPMG